MSHRNLHEGAKFAAGIVAADFIATAWFYMEGLLPYEFMGVTITNDMVGPILIFDAALLMALVHYGWNIGKLPALRERMYLLIAGTLFSAIAIVHIMRVLFGTEVIVDGYSMPLWLSWVGICVTTYLSYMSFRLGTQLKMKKK
jgi:hypothetical protein